MMRRCREFPFPRGLGRTRSHQVQPKALFLNSEFPIFSLADDLEISVVGVAGMSRTAIETIWRFISHAWHAVEVKADAVPDTDHGLADLIRISRQQQPLEVDLSGIQLECEADAGKRRSASTLKPSSSGSSTQID